MPNIQFRNYFIARLTYLYKQGIAESISPLEELSVTEVITIISETDTKAERERPEYWQTMLRGYNEEGNRSLGETRHIIGAMWQNNETPEERAKQTLLMTERYLASKARDETYALK